MSARRLARSTRTSLAVFALGALAAGCSGGALPHAPAPAAPQVCDASRLDACERRLLDGAVDPSAREDRKGLARSYAEARAGRASDDGWAALWGKLTAVEGAAGKAPAVAIIAEGAAPAVDLGGRARVITTSSLAKPELVSEDELLLALAHAAGYAHVVHVDGGRVTQLFPADPLGPFVAGLPAIVRDDGALARLADDVALASTLRAAIEAAAEGRYLDAAHTAERLQALVDARAPWGEPTLRARLALQLLGGAGITLDPPEKEGDDAPPPPTPEAPPPAAEDTAYGDYLRLRLSKDDAKAWSERGPKILAAVAPDRRDDLRALYARAKSCADAARPPPMEGARDLVFAGRLAAALAKDRADEANPARLPLTAWLPRYTKLVELVETTRTAWSFAPTLLYQRGEAFGLSPAGTPTYRRVTELALAHLRAAKELEASEAARYKAMAQVSLIYSPGALGDPVVREALIQLTQATVQDKLAAAKGASGVYGGLFTGAFAGLSYPPAVQEAHYTALQGAFTAKLRGDLLSTTGWGVAGLYAIDAAYRLITDHGPNLVFTSQQIARALGDPAIQQPALAKLATAAGRYAALAAEKKLEVGVIAVDKLAPERRAARDALRAAIADLGPPGEAPNNVLDDVTSLADGLVGTVAVAIAEATAKKDKPVCASKAALPLTPTTRQALAKLGDVRRRILAHPRFKQGDGAWVRRARLLVTILSDGMDLALKEDKPLKLTIADADAERYVTAALNEWGDRAAADAVTGLYALLRAFGATQDPDRFFAQHGEHVRRVVRGLASFLRGDPAGGRGPELGIALLDAATKLDLKAEGGDLAESIRAYASAFYAAGKQDQGDLCLLGSLVLSSVTSTPPSREAVELAAKHKSRIEWALRFLAETAKGRESSVPNPSVYAEGMRRVTDDACQPANAEAPIAVAQAVHDYVGGKRAEARKALDQVLDKADADGLVIPTMNYRYEEKTPTKVFSLSVDLSFGAGMLAGANTFQVGVGVRTHGDPEGKMTVALAPSDTAKAGEEAARYYVQAAALAAVYHFLDGDHDRGVGAARRVVAALSSGVKLGRRPLRVDQPKTVAADARAAIAVAAQLAAEAGMPFLSGDLWTVLQKSLAEDADDEAVADLFEKMPPGLARVKELGPVIDRAKRSLRVIAEPLACTSAKVETGAYEEPSCDAYPLALSLRVADALKKLPHLRRGGDTARCGPLRALDGFLTTVEKGQYDPDAFTRAVEELRGDGRVYEAAVLLARQRHVNHCNPSILATARALGRSALLGPLLRADLLSTALNCGAAAGGPEVEADLVALDEDTRKLPDPSRNLKLLLTMADVAASTDRWGLLAKLTAQPDFVERWMSVHPTAATAALAIAHAVPAVSGGSVDVAATRPAYDLLCETFPPGDRRDLCDRTKRLRAPAEGPAAARQQLAKETVKRVLAEMTGPGPQQKGP